MEPLPPLVAVWQHIPEHFSPVAFEVGGYPVYWYALFFLGGAWLVYRIAGSQYIQLQVFNRSEYQDFAFGTFVSTLVGAKFGFLLFYWWPFLLSDKNTNVPLFPIEGLGLPGMSFFGGAAGAILFLWWYSRKHQKSFFLLTDILAFALPIALFFGRLGNFAHHELPGRVTEVLWGMHASEEHILRHPSALYAAFLEGVVLFAFLFFIKKREFFQQSGVMTAWFCIGYGGLRFVSEIFREPDVQIGYLGMLTLNQYFALVLGGIGVIVYAVKNQKNTV